MPFSIHRLGSLGVLVLSLAGLTLGNLTAASAQSFSGVTIHATDNIFGAGYGDTPAPGGGGGGTVASGYALTAGTGRTLTFSSVTGEVGAGYDLDPSHGPDGYSFYGDVQNINSYRSISGIYSDDGQNDLALVGVFVNGTPSGTAPARIDITTQKGLASFSPLLNQTFFIGDGLTGTGSGTVQQFFVPNGATTLYLGFADAYSFVNNPGYYYDDVGSDVASFKIASPVPEVSTTVSLGLLLALGLGGLVFAARRKKA